MKLFYIANMRFPTERAHGAQVACMCSAFAERHGSNTEQEHGTDTEKIEVTLLVPDRKTVAEDPYAYYGVERNFRIEKIPVPDTVRFGRVGFLLESLVFAWRAARRVREYIQPPLNPLLGKGGEEEKTVVYTREELPLLFLPRRRAFYEAHQLRRSSFFKWLIGRARGVIAITQGLKDALVRSGISESRVLVAHDGYDETQFAERVPQAEARRRLGLSPDRKIAMYIGGFETWKGVRTLCEAARFLAHDGIMVAVVGGSPAEVEKFRIAYPDVAFLGARPYRDLAVNQQAADVLVIPNSARARISREFTSPLKLFAYMASGVLIVASRLPSLTEVLSDANAYLVEPDNPVALVEGIIHAFHSPSESAERAEKAAADVTVYSWVTRARTVLTYMACRHRN